LTSGGNVRRRSSM